VWDGSLRARERGLFPVESGALNVQVRPLPGAGGGGGGGGGGWAAREVNYVPGHCGHLDFGSWTQA
jgi:hypothetical protein